MQPGSGTLSSRKPSLCPHKPLPFSASPAPCDHGPTSRLYGSAHGPSRAWNRAVFALCDRIISPSKVLSGVTRVVACVTTSSLFKPEQHSRCGQITLVYLPFVLNAWAAVTSWLL